MYVLKRHPVSVKAFFRHSLVLTYAYPEELLRPLLPPGLALDVHKGFGFLAVALVQTQNLRPAILPRFFGQDFFLSGYRIFVRLETPSRSIRGLRILRSDADKRLMVFFGNLLTHYSYEHCKATCEERDGHLYIKIDTPGGLADLEVEADVVHKPGQLPDQSPFADQTEARKFAGPLPYTFDFEKETGSIVVIRGVRDSWNPQPVSVSVVTCNFLKHEPFCHAHPVLANAFHVENVPYRWERGRRMSVTPR